MVKRYPGLSDLQSGVEEDKFVLASDYDGMEAAWRNACERGDKAVARLASVERERDEIMAMAERRDGELQARLAELESRQSTHHCENCEAMGRRLAEAEGDAALGRIAIKFVDRAGDVCEVDPADRICREFHAAMSAEVERQFRVRMQRDADSAESVETQPGSPHFDGAAAYERYLDATNSASVEGEK